MVSGGERPRRLGLSPLYGKRGSANLIRRGESKVR